MVYTFKRVLLQYRKTGTVGPYGKVQARDSEKFVALDSSSGGYPYSVTIDLAHDFKTVEEAKRYCTHFEFDVREVTVTFEVTA